MYENMRTALGETSGILVFLIAVSLFFYVAQARINTVSAFESVYQRDASVLLTHQEIEAETITGTDLLLSFGDGLEYPIQIGARSFDAGSRDMAAALSTIDRTGVYLIRRSWNEDGTLNKINYLKQ